MVISERLKVLKVLLMRLIWFNGFVYVYELYSVL